MACSTRIDRLPYYLILSGSCVKGTKRFFYRHNPLFCSQTIYRQQDLIHQAMTRAQ